jgi:hypothetical protein
MFFLEGMSKVFLLILVSHMVSNYDPIYYDNRLLESWYATILVVMLISNILHEIGELHQCGWNPFEYLDVSMLHLLDNLIY